MEPENVASAVEIMDSNEDNLGKGTYSITWNQKKLTWLPQIKTFTLENQSSEARLLKLEENLRKGGVKIMF